MSLGYLAHLNRCTPSARSGLGWVMPSVAAYFSTSTATGASYDDALDGGDITSLPRAPTTTVPTGTATPAPPPVRKAAAAPWLTLGLIAAAVVTVVKFK